MKRTSAFNPDCSGKLAGVPMAKTAGFHRTKKNPAACGILLFRTFYSPGLFPSSFTLSLTIIRV